MTSSEKKMEKKSIKFDLLHDSVYYM